MSEAARLMDRMYRYQRHIYDASRKFYLLGRDGMVADLRLPAGGSVLEIGCGTGRNLVRIARTYPDARCFGLDVSAEMLATAGRATARPGLAHRIRLARGDATAFDPAALFGEAVFDRIVISYALSMIPPWRAVLAEAAGHLAPDGSLHIVDFGDQVGLPRPARWLPQPMARRVSRHPATGTRRCPRRCGAPFPTAGTRGAAFRRLCRAWGDRTGSGPYLRSPEARAIAARLTLPDPTGLPFA